MLEVDGRDIPLDSAYIFVCFSASMHDSDLSDTRTASGPAMKAGQASIRLILCAQKSLSL